MQLDRHGFAWLTLVAVQEAWRMAGPAREQPAGLFLAEPECEGELTEPAGLGDDPIDRVIAHERHDLRVKSFARLKPRERQALLLLAGGYRYTEIAILTGSTYSAVNRRLAEGRARLRDFEGANF
ncbi:sigma-70-like protein [Solirubrobacter pauli]|uniref:Sigma-70-like protein n=1 Tax=Solirubrobacter pauli TaxID=166793 RepID=A0A660LGD3_9ACTN|nr:sigma-70-like protein [Solirubrobacter pauli]